MTGAAEVHDANGTSLGVAEENVLWLQVAVDHVDLWRGQEQQRRAQLLGKLACQVQRDATEIGVPEELVEVVGEKLEDETEMVPEHEVAFQAN